MARGIDAQGTDGQENGREGCHPGRELASRRFAAYLPAMSEAKPSVEPAGEPAATPAPKPAPLPKEIGGAPGPEPTRYGDWEHKGRCTDF
jgi:hypothetical protein